jgi:hypothetical protein
VTVQRQELVFLNAPAKSPEDDALRGSDADWLERTTTRPSVPA